MRSAPAPRSPAGAGVKLLLVLLSVLLPAASGAVRAQPAPAQAGGGVPVTATRAERRDLPIYVSGIGTVQAWRSVQVRAEVTGYVQSLHFREGQEVRQGDLLAMIDPRPYAAVLAQAEAKKAGDEATLANDEVNLRRDSALAKSDFASRQQVDNDTALVRQYQANVQADDAAIAAARLNLDFCRVTAPIDGVVGFRLVDIGNLVQANGTQAIVSLQQVRPIAVVFTLAQDQLPAVRAALAAGKPEVLAFPADGTTPLAAGTLLTPDNSIDSATGTIPLKAVFPNADTRLWPGQFVNAHLRLRTDPGAVTVPLAAVQHGPDRLYVFVVGGDGTARDRTVAVGYQDGSIAEITSGLAGGEQVVTDGQSRLQNGTHVTVRTPAPAS